MALAGPGRPPVPGDHSGPSVTIHTFDDGSAAQECVFPRAQRASLRHTAAGIPQAGGGACGGGGCKECHEEADESMPAGLEELEGTWRGGGVVGIGVGGGSRRSGEEEAGGLGRRQHHPLAAARLVTGGVCVCVCVCGVYWS